jgi:A/G-specific adenine glycosylase
MIGFTDAVLAWGAPRLRDFPWRRTRDPWAILVSEVMLQQTQAQRVIPKYLAFLEAFPTVERCAVASLGDVLRLWHGLGYPRRARNLHAAATQIVAHGSFPDTLEALLALPGVGAYTARAVLAFAFEHDVAVADTNIARVYARVEGRRLTPREVQRVADEALPAGRSWLWNQTIMDVGAMLCRPTLPACAACPCRQHCHWGGATALADPSIGSAGVSTRQAPFDGSERQARGRLMRAVQASPIALSDVAITIARDETTARRLLAGLVREGLLAVDGTAVRLPD